MRIIHFLYSFNTFCVVCVTHPTSDILCNTCMHLIHFCCIKLQVHHMFIVFVHAPDTFVYQVSHAKKCIVTNNSPAIVLHPQPPIHVEADTFVAQICYTLYIRLRRFHILLYTFHHNPQPPIYIVILYFHIYFLLYFWW